MPFSGCCLATTQRLGSPTLATGSIARLCSTIDRVVFDGFLHGAAQATVDVSRWDRRFDERIVDGFVNMIADVTFAAGRSLKSVQTGRLRQYVMFIVVGLVGIWTIIVFISPR